MKLTSFRIAYHNKKEKAVQWFDVDVSVSKVDGAFTFPREQVPEFIKASAPSLKEHEGLVTAGGYKSVYKFDRLLDIEPALRHAVGLFEEAQREEGSSKWIAYKFHMQGNLTPDLSLTEEGSIDYNDFKHSDFSRCMGLAFEWHVISKTRYAGQTRYFAWNGAAFEEDGFKMMEYTEDREKFFEDMNSNMISLMMRIHGFMEIKPDALKQAIDLKQIGSLLPALPHVVKQTKPKGKKK